MEIVIHRVRIVTDNTVTARIRHGIGVFPTELSGVTGTPVTLMYVSSCSTQRYFNDNVGALLSVKTCSLTQM